MPEQVTVIITETTPGGGSRFYQESGRPSSVDVDSLTPNTEYRADAEYEAPDGTTIQASNSMTFRTLPVGMFSISNPNWQNDNDGQHSTFTFDYTSTYALSYAQVVDMATGVTYQGTIVGSSVTAQLPAGTAGTQHNFQLIIADIYGYDYVQGYVMTLEASLAETPFYIEAENPSDAPQITLTKTGSPTSLTMQISYDKSTWTNYTFGDSISLDSTHPRVYFKNSSQTLFSTGTSNYYRFTADNYVNVGGNIASLKDSSMSSNTSNNYDFYNLLYRNTHLRNADKLYLGNYTTLANNCYRSMFKTCTGLIKTPVLPATTMAAACYDSMFYECTSLTQAPTLPATTLDSSCYHYMFYGCTYLTQAPTLPTTTRIPPYCYSGMFTNCISLTRAPELPATAIGQSSYYSMFSGCTSLIHAPEVLPATTLSDYCYSYMFSGCIHLTQAPELPAADLVYSCYSYMFENCTSLDSITCLAKNRSATNCTLNWVSGVAAYGTFYKSPAVSTWSRGASGIPINWTVVDYQN